MFFGKATLYVFNQLSKRPDWALVAFSSAVAANESIPACTSTTIRVMGAGVIVMIYLLVSGGSGR